jgi:hypothetical protein
MRRWVNRLPVIGLKSAPELLQRANGKAAAFAKWILEFHSKLKTFHVNKSGRHALEAQRDARAARTYLAA